MTIVEAINILEMNNPFLGSDERLTEAFDIAIKALRLLENIKANGYTVKKMQFRIGGRLFEVREMAQ